MDVVLEVVGYPQVVSEGLEMLRRGGTFVEIGNIQPDSNLTIDVSKLLWRSTKIVATAHYDPYILPVALDFLKRTKDSPLMKVMSHGFPLERLQAAFEQCGVVRQTPGAHPDTSLPHTLRTMHLDSPIPARMAKPVPVSHLRAETAHRHLQALSQPTSASAFRTARPWGSPLQTLLQLRCHERGIPLGGTR